MGTQAEGHPALADQKLEGGCQCGAVRYAVSRETLLAGICHCAMCRRAHAAPAVGWATYYDTQVTFTRAAPAWYASSDVAQRGFCPRCGTQVAFTASYMPGLIDIPLGSLDDPEALPPMVHYWHAQHLAWAEFADSMPRFPEAPPQE